MNAVGIDVSKGRSTAAILRPMGEVRRMISTMKVMDLAILRIVSCRWGVKIRC